MLRMSRDLGIPHRRLMGWEPRTYSRTHPGGLTITSTDPEWGPEDRAGLAALAEWEADRCSCGCGQSMAESLIDSKVPLAERPRWTTGFFECGAGLALANAREKQHQLDEQASKRLGQPVPTSHRLWQVAKQQPAPDEET